MATNLKQSVLLFLSFAALLSCCSRTHAQVEEAAAGGLKMMMGSLEWPASMSMYGAMEESSDFDDGLEGLDGDVEGSDEMGDRRSLYWGRPVHYYISYGALSANRIPCPPRSGRSYYTHGCFKSRAPVNPYSRGCSRITRCRR